MSDSRSAFNWRGTQSIFMLPENWQFWTKEYAKFRGTRRNDDHAPFVSKLGHVHKAAADVLRKNKQSNISYSTRNCADKTNKILGRRNAARSQ